jgi:hypothetical protein
MSVKVALAIQDSTLPSILAPLDQDRIDCFAHSVNPFRFSQSGNRSRPPNLALNELNIAGLMFCLRQTCGVVKRRSFSLTIPMFAAGLMRPSAKVPFDLGETTFSNPTRIPLLKDTYFQMRDKTGGAHA